MYADVRNGGKGGYPDVDKSRQGSTWVVVVGQLLLYFCGCPLWMTPLFVINDELAHDPVEKWSYYQTTSECLVVNPDSEQRHFNKNCPLWLHAEQTPATFFLSSKLRQTPWSFVKNVCGLSKGVPQVRHAWQQHWHKLYGSVNLLEFEHWTPFHLKTRFESAWLWSIVLTSVWKQ